MAGLRYKPTIGLVMVGLTTVGCMGWFKTRPAPPTVEYAYVATGLNVAQYSVGTDGQLNPLTPATAPAPSSVAITVAPNNHFAYTANGSDGNVSQFSVGKEGLLTALSPPTVGAGGHPNSIVINPTSTFLYVLNHSDSTISEFSVADNGQISPLTPPTVPVAADGNGLVISPSGSFLYATSFTSGEISAYSISASGQLVPLAVPTYNVVAPSQPAISPNGNYLYVPLSGSAVAQYGVNADGSLLALTPPTVTTSALGDDCAAVSPNSSFCYVGMFNGGNPSSPVDQFGIGSDGTLSPLNPATVTAGNAPFSISIDPDGKFAYVSNLTDGTLSEFSIGSNGTLGALTPSTVNPGGAYRLAFAVR